MSSIHEPESHVPISADQRRVAILADVPLWTVPGLEHLHVPGHYATWLEALVPELSASSEFDIHWITISKMAASPLHHSAYGQTFHILPRWKKSLSMATGYLQESRQISSLVRSLSPCLVHAWGTEDVYGIAGAQAHAPVRLFTLQGCLTDYLKRLGGSMLFRLQAMYERRTLRRYAFGTAESPSAAECMRRLNPKMDIRLVDYGVNEDFFGAKWLPGDVPEIVFVGAVTHRKGIEDLIAVASLPEMQHIRFTIMGDGDLFAQLQKRSTSNVVWRGKCSRQDVISTLSRSWCLVVPTYADTGPTVVKEARVIGLPVITTNEAGASTYVKDTGAGSIVSAGDQAGLSKAIKEITLNRDMCISTGQRGHPDARVNLSASGTAREFLSLYNQLLTR